MLIQLAAASILLWFLVMKWRRRPFEKLYEQMKISAPRMPFIGHLYMLLCSEEERMEKFKLLGIEAMDKRGITGFWFAQKLFIIVADSEVADIVMKTCLEKDDSMKCFHIATGNGSIFTSVEKWRPRRKYLNPIFSMKNLNHFVENFSKRSGFVVDKIRKEMAAGNNTIAMGKTYVFYAMNGIFGSLGLPLSSEENADDLYQLALEKIITSIVARFFQPWLYNDFLYKLLPRYHKTMQYLRVVFGILDKTIKEKRKQIENYNDDLKNGIPTSNSLKSFIDLMIELPANLSDITIREECIVLIAAASDSSAVNVGYSTLMLARYPELQEKIYQELKETIGDLDRPIAPEDLPHLKYLEAFIRETLRLYPPVPIIVRKVVSDVELPSGVTLLSGCTVMIHIWAINRNPKYWGEDAEEFRPERFLDTAPRHPAAFLSFSHGPRNCLGFQYAMMSAKTVIATLLSQFRVVASDELGTKPLRVKYDLMMRHIDDYPVKFESRK